MEEKKDEEEGEDGWFKEKEEEERTEQEGNCWVLQVNNGVSQGIGCLLEVKDWVLEENDWGLQVKGVVLEKEEEEEALEGKDKEDN